MFKSMMHGALVATGLMLAACGSNQGTTGAATQSVNTPGAQAAGAVGSVGSAVGSIVNGITGSGNNTITIPTFDGNITVSATNGNITVVNNGNVVFNSNSYAVAGGNSQSISLHAGGCIAVIVNGHQEMDGDCSACKLAQASSAYTLTCTTVPTYGSAGGTATIVNGSSSTTSSCETTFNNGTASPQTGTCGQCSVTPTSGSVVVSCND